MMGKPPAAASENAGRMSFVHDEHPARTVCKLHQIVQRRAVAIHAVKAFNGDPDRSLFSRTSVRSDAICEGLHIIMPGADPVRPAKPHPVMGARMDKGVVNDQVAELRQGSEDGDVRRVAAGKIQGRLTAEKGCGLGFERRMHARVYSLTMLRDTGSPALICCIDGRERSGSACGSASRSVGLWVRARGSMTEARMENPEVEGSRPRDAPRRRCRGRRRRSRARRSRGRRSCRRRGGRSARTGRASGRS